MPPIQKKRAIIVTRAAKRAAEAAAARAAAFDPSKSLTTFELFPRLPTEIRLKVWQFATNGCDARIVQVKIKNLVTKYSEHGRGVVFSSATPIPGVLHACSESREVALCRYRLSMSSFASGPRIFLDYSSDTIYFGEVLANHTHFALSSLLKDLHDDDISKIRHLGVAQEIWNNNPFCNIHVCVDFPSLERITFTMEKPVIGKEVAFVPVKDREEHYTSFSMGGYMDDEEEVFCWPDEADMFLSEHFFDAYEKHDLTSKMPDLEFKMLCDKRSRVKSRKAAGKGKAK